MGAPVEGPDPGAHPVAGTLKARRRVARHAMRDAIAAGELVLPEVTCPCGGAAHLHDAALHPAEHGVVEHPTSWVCSDCLAEARCAPGSLLPGGPFATTRRTRMSPRPAGDADAHRASDAALTPKQSRRRRRTLRLAVAAGEHALPDVHCDCGGRAELHDTTLFSLAGRPADDLNGEPFWRCTCCPSISACVPGSFSPGGAGTWLDRRPLPPWTPVRPAADLQHPSRRRAARRAVLRGDAHLPRVFCPCGAAAFLVDHGLSPPGQGGHVADTRPRWECRRCDAESPCAPGSFEPSGALAPAPHRLGRSRHRRSPPERTVHPLERRAIDLNDSRRRRHDRWYAAATRRAVSSADPRASVLRLEGLANRRAEALSARAARRLAEASIEIEIRRCAAEASVLAIQARMLERVRASIGPACPCGSAPRLQPAEKAFPNQRKLSGRHGWVCPACERKVLCHPGTHEPLGTLADAPTRAARRLAHLSFDALWRHDVPGARSLAYAWLARALGLHVDQTHIALFDLTRCEQVIAIVDAHRARGATTPLSDPPPAATAPMNDNDTIPIGTTSVATIPMHRRARTMPTLLPNDTGSPR